MAFVLVLLIRHLSLNASGGMGVFPHMYLVVLFYFRKFRMKGDMLHMPADQTSIYLSCRKPTDYRRLFIL